MPEILYEDNHLLIANKPAGLLTQPDSTTRDSLESLLKRWLKEKYDKPGNVFLEATHRLDRPVSGIVVFAKTSKGLSRVNAAMRAKKASKRYLALTEKIPKRPEGDLEHYLLHDDFHARIVASHVKGAKKAHLHYSVIQPVGQKALVDVTLFTGRYHQIRVQLAAIGCPIVGDGKYGSSVPSDTIALHHYHLELPHPITQELLKIDAPCQWDPRF